MNASHACRFDEHHAQLEDQPVVLLFELRETPERYLYRSKRNITWPLLLARLVQDPFSFTAFRVIKALLYLRPSCSRNHAFTEVGDVDGRLAKAVKIRTKYHGQG